MAQPRSVRFRLSQQLATAGRGIGVPRFRVFWLGRSCEAHRRYRAASGPAAFAAATKALPPSGDAALWRRSGLRRSAVGLSAAVRPALGAHPAQRVHPRALAAARAGRRNRQLERRQGAAARACARVPRDAFAEAGGLSMAAQAAALNLATPALDERSKHLRRLAVRTLHGGERGHVGSSMSLIEIMRVLYDDVLRYRPAEPKWSGRDRMILSKGHGCIAQYVMLAEKGFIPYETLDTFCRRDSILGGHPEAAKIPGVEASTGSLGHGLSYGVGMALAARIDKRDSRIIVVMGDGEINEGSVWEAALSAGKHRLSNLTAVVDYNKVQSAGPTRDVQDLEPLLDKWRAFNFAAVDVDGHDVEALCKVFRRLPLAPDRPSAVICHTVKGKGIAFAENDANWHHKSKIGKDVVGRLYAALE